VAGCDAGPRDQEPLDLPPVHVTEIRAATKIDVVVDEFGERASVAYGAIDPGGSSSVAPNSSFHVRFDRLLLPVTATRQAICLQPLFGNVVGPNQCTAGIFSEPSYDPVRREVVYRQAAPSLVPGTLYELTLYSAVNDADNGIRSFEGIGLEAPFRIEFGVLDVPPLLPLPSDALTGDRFCAAPDPGCNPTVDPTCARSVSRMLSSCSFGGCHGVSPEADAGAAGQPSEGLCLGSTVDLLATAIGHVAHETETGEAASQIQDIPLRFGKSMPVIAPLVPGNSYVLYKLLANPDTPLTIPFPADPSSPGADPPEIVRLQRSLVVGLPMPPSQAPDFARPRPGELEWLSDWIVQGAVTVPSCP
jgi:hypothetical protein